MQENLSKDLKYWQFRSFAAKHPINHFISGRTGGISSGELGTLNLSYKVGDEPTNVLWNRGRLASLMDIYISRIYIFS